MKTRELKRTEVIALIADIMQKNFDYDNGSWEVDAEKVLNFLEKKVGMLPPGRLNPKFGGHNPLELYRIHEWIPEEWEREDE